MKRNILYILIGYLVFSLMSCSKDPEDATSKHVYGEDESPYLKVNTDATTSFKMDFPTGRIEAKTINLKEYAEKFHNNMGMTVDEVIAGLANGDIVFYNINVARSCWNKTAMTKGNTGWYYNSAGGISTSEKGVACIDIDTGNKTLTVNMVGEPEVGTALTINVGFAINNGKDYDDYIRFSFSLAVTDPGRIVVSNTIPTGDYEFFSINFADYAEAIQTCMDMTVREFSSAVGNKDGALAMYVIDMETGEWDKESNYTANGIGFWMSNQGKVCAYGDSGATFYIETGDGCVNIGRHVNIPSGGVYKMNFVYANKEDNSKFVEFIVTATMD